MNANDLLDRAALRVIPPLCVPTGLSFQASSSPAERHGAIEAIQRFRGRTYLTDGAIPSESLDDTGGHRSAADHGCWHIVALDSDRLCGCIRLSVVAAHADLRELQLASVIDRLAPAARLRVWEAVEQHSQWSTSTYGQFGEVSGWAVAAGNRRSSTSIILPLACWSLYRILGNVAPIAVATTRHGSAHILKRLGGFDLSAAGSKLDPFYDEYYRCDLQILGFDSRCPDVRYAGVVDAIERHFRANPTPVSCCC